MPAAGCAIIPFCMRMQFIGPMQAGIFLGNANTLDHWVWDSLFQNVLWGVTNYIPERGANGGLLAEDENRCLVGRLQVYRHAHKSSSFRTSIRTGNIE